MPFYHQLPQAAPRLYPTLRRECGGLVGGAGNESFSTRAVRTRGQCPAIQAPLRQAMGVETQLVFVHVPFTKSDLNWKQSVGSYWNNPEGMYQLLETVVLTHSPNWGDVKALKHFLYFGREDDSIRKGEGGRRM